MARRLLHTTISILIGYGQPLNADSNLSYKVIELSNNKTIFVNKSDIAKNGAAGITSFISTDMSEIRWDQNHDGITDMLVMQNKKMKIIAFNPAYGRFLNINAEIKEKRGLRHLTFYLNRNGKNYQLYEQRLEPYQLFGDSGEPTLGFETAPQIETDFCPARRAKFLKTKALDLIDLAMVGVKPQLDSSCLQNENFPSKNIENGVFSVLSSYKDSHNYLGCLHDHKLDFLGDSILINYYLDAASRFNRYQIFALAMKHLNRANTNEGSGNSFNLFGGPNQNDRFHLSARQSGINLDSNNPYISNRTSGSTQSRFGLFQDFHGTFTLGSEQTPEKSSDPWLVCSAKSPEEESMDLLGSYNNDSQRITIYENKAQTSKMSQMQLNEYYGDLIFHEALHSTGLVGRDKSRTEEQNVRALEACCGTAEHDTSKRTAACKAVDEHYDANTLLKDAYISRTLNGLDGLQAYYMRLSRVAGTEVAKNIIGHFGSVFNSKSEECLKNHSCDSIIKENISTVLSDGCKLAPDANSCNVVGGELVQILENNSTHGCKTTVTLNLVPMDWLNSLFNVIIPRAYAGNSGDQYSCVAKVFDGHGYSYPWLAELDLNNPDLFKPVPLSQLEFRTANPSTGSTNADTFTDTMKQPTVPVPGIQTGTQTTPTAVVPININNIGETKSYIDHEYASSQSFFSSISQAADFVSQSILPTAKADSALPTVTIPVNGTTNSVLGRAELNSQNAIYPNDHISSGSSRLVDSPPSEGSRSGPGGGGPTGTSNSNSGNSNGALGSSQSSTNINKNTHYQSQTSNSQLKGDSPSNDKTARSGGANPTLGKANAPGSNSSRSPANVPPIATNRKSVLANRLELIHYLRTNPYTKIEKDMVAQIHEHELKLLFSQVVLKDGRGFGASGNQAVFFYKYDTATKSFKEHRKGAK